MELLNANDNSYLESDVFELFCSALLTFWNYPREAETGTSQEICVNIMSAWGSTVLVRQSYYHSLREWEISLSKHLSISRQTACMSSDMSACICVRSLVEIFAKGKLSQDRVQTQHLTHALVCVCVYGCGLDVGWIGSTLTGFFRGTAATTSCGRK